MTYANELEALRKEIDRIDEQIIRLLSERIKVSIEVGIIKRKYNKPILDSNRETEVYKRIRERAEQLNIDPEESESIFKGIVKMCRSAQGKEF
ncbi:MAG: chorismate mutase [Nitrososphaeria archaeon]